MQHGMLRFRRPRCIGSRVVLNAAKPPTTVSAANKRPQVIFFGAGIAAAFPNGVGLGRKVYPRPLVGIVQARR